MASSYRPSPPRPEPPDTLGRARADLSRQLRGRDEAMQSLGAAADDISRALIAADEQRARDGLEIEAALDESEQRSAGQVAALASTTASTTAALDERVSELEGELEVICAAYIATDGAGGFTTNTSSGCVVAISGTSLLVTFDVPRSSLNYGVTAINANGANVATVVQNETATSFQLREFTTTTGATRSFATTAIQCSLAVVGPRP